jgi:hypothetical protein
MRKEEEVEEVPGAPRMAAEEVELSDEELLGEATLAKLGGRTTYIAAEDEEIDFDMEEEEVKEVKEEESDEEEVEEAWEEEEEIEEEFLKGEGEDEE